jgi:hypothetical protein
VQQQAERVGSEAVAAQAVSRKAILEFFNAVLTFPAIVIKGKDGTAAAFSVGDEKAHVGSRFGVFGLVTDAPLMRPGASAIENSFHTADARCQVGAKKATVGGFVGKTAHATRGGG